MFESPTPRRSKREGNSTTRMLTLLLERSPMNPVIFRKHWSACCSRSLSGMTVKAFLIVSCSATEARWHIDYLMPLLPMHLLHDRTFSMVVLLFKKPAEEQIYKVSRSVRLESALGPTFPVQIKMLLGIIFHRLVIHFFRVRRLRHCHGPSCSERNQQFS